MTDVVIQKLTYRAEFDAQAATAGAAKYEKRLEGVTKRQRELSTAERAAEKTAAALRAELLKLGRAELDAAADKKALAQQARVVRQGLREQAEASKALRQEQTALRAEERALTAERQRGLRVLEQEAQAIRRSAAATAAATAATERARGRSGRAGDRLRGVYQKQGEAGGRIEALQASIASLNAELGMSTGAKMRRSAGAALGRMRDEAPGRFVSGLPGAVSMAGGAALGGGLAVAGGVGAVARAGGEFEGLRAQLGTALKTDSAGSDKAFEQVKQFAKETPFAVKEVVAAVTTLKVRGLEPTVEAAMEALKTYGDVAGAMGKDLPQVVEAVSDAANGEFERLKEAFNVTGHKMGDELALTFNGITANVKNNKEAITDYLKSIGKENFAGGMQKQAATLGGVWSNLGDAVSIFADEIYRGGLGDALKEVLGDLTGNIEGAESLATTIGKALAHAVRDAYEWLKKMIGPFDQLPAKFNAAWEAGQQFVGVVTSIIEAGANMASYFGESGIATLALVGFAGAVLGPLGAVAAVAYKVGYAIAEMVSGGEEAMSLKERMQKHQDRVDAVRDEALHNQHVKKMGEDQADLDASRKAADRWAKTSDRVEKETLRRHGVTSVDQLPEDVQRKLSGFKSKLASSDARDDTFASVEADTIPALKRQADEAEYGRLNAKGKKGRSASEEKRFGEVAADLNRKKPTGSGKAKDSAYDAEQKGIIESAAKDAALRAASEARLTGRGAEAGVLSERAERETRERLTAMGKRGDSLPDQVNTDFARVAGYGAVTGAPPPPVFVQNNRFEVKSEVHVEGGTFTGDPSRVAAATSAALVDLLERDVFPEVARLLQPGFTR